MRRQVKPFVTEYRASNRKTKETASPGHLPRDVVHDGAAREPLRSKQDETGSDRHGAALRAADALFSVRGTAPGDDMRTAKTADSRSAAEAVFAPPAQDAASTQPSEHRLQERRILRAIDTPSLEASINEIGDAPLKRRGRKPGSKNKPKPMALGEVDVLASSALSGSLADLPGASVAPASETERRAAFPVSQGTKPTDRRTRREPFAWVRRKLKPGEKWKRRLPKVAW